MIKIEVLKNIIGGFERWLEKIDDGCEKRNNGRDGGFDGYEQLVNKVNFPALGFY